MLSAAYDFAFTYFKSAISLMHDNYWQTHYDLALEIHNSGMESAFASSNFEEMNKIDKVILSNANKSIDKVKRYKIMITHSTKNGNNIEANQIAIEILRLLGINIPNTLRNYKY